MEVVPENFLGTTHTRAKEEHVSKRVDLYVKMLQKSAEECEAEGVKFSFLLVKELHTLLYFFHLPCAICNIKLRLHQKYVF